MDAELKAAICKPQQDWLDLIYPNIHGDVGRDAAGAAMSTTGRCYLKNILATVEQIAPGRRLDCLVMSYATRARLAATQGFDEACYHAGIRMTCDPMMDRPVYRLYPYVEGDFCGKVIDLLFPEKKTESRVIIRRRHLALVEAVN